MVPVLAEELRRKRFPAVREFNLRVGSLMYRRALKEVRVCLEVRKGTSRKGHRPAMNLDRLEHKLYSLKEKRIIRQSRFL